MCQSNHQNSFANQHCGSVTGAAIAHLPVFLATTVVVSEKTPVPVHAITRLHPLAQISRCQRAFEPIDVGWRCPTPQFESKAIKISCTSSKYLLTSVMAIVLLHYWRLYSLVDSCFFYSTLKSVGPLSIFVQLPYERCLELYNRCFIFAMKFVFLCSNVRSLGSNQVGKGRFLSSW